MNTPVTGTQVTATQITTTNESGTGETVMMLHDAAIDSPTSSGLWVMEPNAHPATNTVLHDAAHDSKLLLGVLPGGRAEAPALPCDTMLNQPCRTNMTPVPAGHVDVSSP